VYTRSCMSGTSFLCELRASVRSLRLLAGFPDLRLLCPIRHPVGIRRSPACLHAPCLTIPLAPTPPACEQVGSSPVRVPTLSVSWFRIKQEPSGLPEFSDASLPAYISLMTPADIRTPGLRRTSTHLPNSACFMLTSRTLTCRHPLTLLSRSCPDPNRRTSGSAISPTAYRILCVRLPCNSLCSRGTKLRSRTNTRYGWVASPYPTGTFTRQEAPSFARRDNAANQPREVRASAGFALLAVFSSPPLHRHPADLFNTLVVP
jgi:hypothetical protein